MAHERQEFTAGYTFTPSVGCFTSPAHTPGRQEERLLVSLPTDWQCEVKETAQVSKQQLVDLNHSPSTD